MGVCVPEQQIDAGCDASAWPPHNECLTLLCSSSLGLCESEGSHPIGVASQAAHRQEAASRRCKRQLDAAVHTPHCHQQPAAEQDQVTTRKAKSTPFVDHNGSLQVEPEAARCHANP